MQYPLCHQLVLLCAEALYLQLYADVNNVQFISLTLSLPS